MIGKRVRSHIRKCFRSCFEIFFEAVGGPPRPRSRSLAWLGSLRFEKSGVARRFCPERSLRGQSFTSLFSSVPPCSQMCTCGVQRALVHAVQHGALQRAPKRVRRRTVHVAKPLAVVLLAVQRECTERPFVALLALLAASLAASVVRILSSFCSFSRPLARVRQ